MPRADIVKTTPVIRTARVQQLEGLFDLAPAETSTSTWQVNLPIEERNWNIGIIVGPSGSGKSTVAREFFKHAIIDNQLWPQNKSVIDGFPNFTSIKDVTALLSSVGFSSPPAWLRPYQALSTGEQFRVTIARALAETSELVVIDEFTSVVDRTVAKIGSAAIAKTVRRAKRQFVAVACHYDIIDWLQPDWIYEPHTNEFAWRSVQPRPGIKLEITRTSHEAWRLFAHHHYLSRTLHKSARCFVAAFPNGTPVAFASVISFPHATKPGYREHRTVCLPDYQGVGIGNALSEFVASIYRGTGRPYYSSTGNPAMIRHRARSPLWRMVRAPSRTAPLSATSGNTGLSSSLAVNRYTASFEYVGFARKEDAQILKLKTYA
jgi:ABC-type ATPase involved in cell division/GNAT superfamily N-acetyltransferase